MSHTCHAQDCNVPVPPAMLMCRPHWAKVPRDLQRAVWREYDPGQEIRKDPTGSYLKAARAAINAVAEKEGKATRPGLAALEAPEPVQDTFPGMP